MNDFINSSIGFYVFTTVLSLATIFINRLTHAGIQRLEQSIAQKVPSDVSLSVNDFLDAVDKLSESAVQDANSRMVIGLKASGGFTQEVAASIKHSVMNDVMMNLGPLVQKGAALVGPVDSIVSKAIEKHVLAYKLQVDSFVQATKTTQTPA